MNSSLQKNNPNKYELTVELNRDDLAGYLKMAENMISEEVQIDGFRKGKVPREKVREKVGDQHILEQALDIALQDSLAKILNEQKLEVIEASNLSIKENSAAKLIYTVALSTFPSVELADITKIKVKKREIEVKDQDVDEAVNFVRTSRAKFLPKNGAIEKGNRVEVSFEIISEGLPIEGGVSSNHPLIAGDNRFIPGFEEQLLGMKPGDEKKFILKVPASHFHKSIAGKALDCSVKIENVQIVEKPILNDEFARSLGQFQGLDDFRRNVREGLTEEKKVKEKQRLRLEIISKISERSKADIPKEMIDDKLNEMIAGFDNDLHLKGMELSLYLTHLGKTEDDLRADWQSEAEKQVKYALVLRKVAKEKKLQPTQSEIEEETKQAVQSLVLQGQTGLENIDMNRVRDVVSLDLTNEKVFSFLENNCIQQ